MALLKSESEDYGHHTAKRNTDPSVLAAERIHTIEGNVWYVFLSSLAAPLNSQALSKGMDPRNCSQLTSQAYSEFGYWLYVIMSSIAGNNSGELTK